MKGVWKATRRYITLVEILIVMALIAMILGVVAFNYQGALDEGRAFETRGNIEKVRTILTLRLASDPALIDTIPEKWKDYVKNSPLVQGGSDKVTKDGWGEELRVTVEQMEEGPVINVKSSRLEAYLKK